MDFSSLTLDKIRSAARIADVVSKKVKLQRKGKAYLGLCPFHKEKTPSFSVNEDKQYYHCFGCGAHGDAIKFIQDTQNLKFVEAVKFLALEYNIRLEQSFINPVEKSNKNKILEINKAASDWFHKNMHSNVNAHVLEYLSARGIKIDIINKFNLGYAPSDPKLLVKYLLSLGYGEKEIILSGLTNEKYGEQICRFRERVIFTITNINGGIIAFGGRVISGDALPKYLNSPETLVFQKKNSLYLEEVALNGIKHTDTIFVVEGYIDAISLHSIGLTNTVATLGTAITELHLQKLWSKVYTPTICMDGDRAGLAAMDKAIRIALPMLKPGYSLRFIRLPKGYDPDSLIKTHGATYFKDLAEKAVNLSDLIWNISVNKLNLDIPENKALLKATLLNLTDTIIDPSIKSFYKQFFLEKLSSLSHKFYRKAKEPRGALLDNRLIENLSLMQRYEFTLAAILINEPTLLFNHDLFDKFTAIIPSTKVLDSAYSAIASSFTELSQDLADFPTKEFHKRIKGHITEDFFNYLCSNSSYFIDTIAVKTMDASVELWFGTFERYHLELMKAEYKGLLKGFDDKNLEMAAKLKREIDALENKIRAHAVNK